MDKAAQREALLDEQVQLTARLREITSLLQQLCDHTWHWHQIAGEGQVCYKCGARNYNCDD